MNDRLELEMEVQDLLGVVALLQDARASKLLSPYKLNKSQFTLLFLLSTEPNNPWTVSKLADHLEINKPGISKIVSYLNQIGYLDIEKSTTDKRQKYVSITKQGKKKCKTILAAMFPVVRYVFSEWNSAELEDFRVHLNKLKNWLDEHRDDFYG